MYAFGLVLWEITRRTLTADKVKERTASRASPRFKYLNIWSPMPLFWDVYFIYRYRYNMEVDDGKIETYNISVVVLLVVL